MFEFDRQPAVRRWKATGGGWQAEEARQVMLRSLSPILSFHTSQIGPRSRDGLGNPSPEVEAQEMGDGFSQNILTRGSEEGEY